MVVGMNIFKLVLKYCYRVLHLLVACWPANNITPVGCTIRNFKLNFIVDRCINYQILYINCIFRVHSIKKIRLLLEITRNSYYVCSECEICVLTEQAVGMLYSLSYQHCIWDSKRHSGSTLWCPPVERCRLYYAYRTSQVYPPCPQVMVCFHKLTLNMLQLYSKLYLFFKLNI